LATFKNKRDVLSTGFIGVVVAAVGVDDVAYVIAPSARPSFERF
jgi:hypothetical protein